MKSFYGLKAEMDVIHLLILEVTNERPNALKEVKRLCKEFDFEVGVLKCSLNELWKKQC